MRSRGKVLVGLVALTGVGCARRALATAAPPRQAPTAITVRATPDPSSAGQPVTVAGRALGARGPTRVSLWQRRPGQRRFRRVAVVFSDARGRYQLTLAPSTNRTWYATAAGIRSPLVSQRVRARVTLLASATGSAVRLVGRVRPSHAGERILLQSRAGRGWAVLARPRLDGASRFTTVRRLPLPAQVRAVLAGDRRNIRSVSSVLTVAGPTVLATLGAATAILPNRFGVNWDYTGAALFSSDLAAEDASLAALEPGTLRWPGGTGANYFQWQLGYPTTEQHGFRDTLADLAAAYRATGAAPVFDLNVMSSDLTSQEQMLRAAQGVGLPVRYVELGNEFYLSDPDYVRRFPTAALYGQTVASYVIALHRDFPGVQVAAVGSLGSGTLRERTWNQQMLIAAAVAGGLPDAITLHVKPSWEGPVTARELPALFAQPYANVAEANAVLGALVPPEPAWITEYNLYPGAATNPAQALYAHALLVAEDALLLLGVHDATLVDYWTALSDSLNSAYVPSPSGAPALTPAGLALQWVQSAAAGATSAQPLIFGGGPLLWQGGPPALIGYRFFSQLPAQGGPPAAYSPRAVVVNLSPAAVVLAAGAAIGPGLPYRQVRGDPTQPVAYAGELERSAGSVGGTLQLPPYSITLVG